MGAIISATKPGGSAMAGDYWVDPATGLPYWFDGTSFRGQRYHIFEAQQGVVASNWAVTGYVWVNPSGTYVVRRLTTRYKTAGGSGCTLNVSVDPSGTAGGAGTAQLSAAIDMTQAADTPYNGALIATPTTIAAGSALSLVFAGTVTGLAYCAVDIEIERLS